MTRSRWEVVRRQLRVPLVRNAYSLVGSTIANAGLGVVFWVVAARAYSAADVGLGAALIATMVLLGNLAQLNLVTAFNRFVPTAGHRIRRLVLAGYAVTVVLSAVAALGFAGGIHAGLWAPKLAPLLGPGPHVAWFAAATMLWTVFTLEDAVLTGLGEAHWVLVENSAYGVLKLVLLAVVAGRLPHFGIFIAWSIPLVLCVGAVNRLLFARLIPARADAPTERIDARAVGRFVSADYLSSLMSTAAGGLIPLLVLGVAGKAATAYVYLAYTISYTLYLVSLNVGMSMITEVAQAPDRLVEYARKTVGHSLALVVPIAAVLAVGAPWFLRVFGADYASHATHLLQLFALSAVPAVFTTTYLNVMRARRAMSVVVVVTFVQSVATLVLMYVLLHAMGITGVGLAWLVVQSAIGLFLLGGELRELWLPYLRPGTRAGATDRSRLTAEHRSRRTVLGFGLDTLESSGLAARGWMLEDLLADTGNTCLLAVRSAATGEPGLLKVATTERGRAVLGRASEALEFVRSRAPGPLLDVVPRTLAAPAGAAPAWTLETRCRGLDARAAIDGRDGVGRLVADIADRMSALYRSGAAAVRVDAAALTRLVDEPLAATATAQAGRMRALDPSPLARLRSALHGDLAGRVITASMTHGDLWLGNTRWDPRTGRVTGIVDWHAAAASHPAVDVAYLVCTTRALCEGRELGAVARDVLDAGTLGEPETRLLDAVPGAGELSLRTVVLLAWLGHVADRLARSPRLGAHPVWVEQNVRRVLAAC